MAEPVKAFFSRTSLRGRASTSRLRSGKLPRHLVRRSGAERHQRLGKVKPRRLVGALA
jgi:hypothetical protein